MLSLMLIDFVTKSIWQFYESRYTWVRKNTFKFSGACPVCVKTFPEICAILGNCFQFLRRRLLRIRILFLWLRNKLLITFWWIRLLVRFQRSLRLARCRSHRCNLFLRCGGWLRGMRRVRITIHILKLLSLFSNLFLQFLYLDLLIQCLGFLLQTLWNCEWFFRNNLGVILYLWIDDRSECLTWNRGYLEGR